MIKDGRVHWGKGDVFAHQGYSGTSIWGMPPGANPAAQDLIDSATIPQFLRAAGEGCMQAIRDINVADEVLQWCQEKLPQHQVTPSPCLISRHRRSLSLLPC